MGKTYRAYLPEQDFLLPPSLADWLPEDHLAYFVSDVVEQLDLSAIESVYEEEGKRQRNYTVDERRDWWGSQSCLRRGHLVDGRKRDFATVGSLAA
jgi:hypothetical protein